MLFYFRVKFSYKQSFITFSGQRERTDELLV